MIFLQVYLMIQKVFYLCFNFIILGLSDLNSDEFMKYRNKNDLNNKEKEKANPMITEMINKFQNKEYYYDNDLSMD